jgi:uncharacterized protein (TIGR02466 family)
MIKGVTESLFPIPVYISDGYKLKTKVKNRLIKETSSYLYANKFDNKTSVNHNVLNLPYMSALKKHLMEQINHYVYEVLCITKSVELYITQSWLNVNPSETAHHPHHHFNSFVSGTYYLQGSTPILFIHNTEIFQNFDFDITKQNYFNANFCQVPIKEGRCVLFPSTLHHGVNPNEDKEERISLSFNTFIKGDLRPEIDRLTKLTLK